MELAETASDTSTAAELPIRRVRKERIVMFSPAFAGKRSDTRPTGPWNLNDQAAR